MTELEQRLTNEFGKLAEQYEQEQKRLAGQVERLEEQVRKLAEQYARDQKRLARAGYSSWPSSKRPDLNGYIEWSKRTGEHLDNFSGYANTLAERYNEMIRLMERRWL